MTELKTNTESPDWRWTAAPETARREGRTMTSGIRRPISTTATSMTRVDANGTQWRLRSLIAMGHDCARIARAQVSALSWCAASSGARHALLPGSVPSPSSSGTRGGIRPRRLAPPPNGALLQARSASPRTADGPAAAGLDEDELDRPGYRPSCRYQPATGKSIAPDFPPARLRPLHHAKEIA
jgi:hypothetical protein